MCGISGFNWRDTQLAEQMNTCLKHRGPDASGIFSGEGVTLAHRRLAIIDLSPEANQPMRDHQAVIVFNGEIYNYKELKAELAGTYDFKTASDTEVILAGYAAWGKDVVRHLNGIFAFALWDTRSQELFVARDHMGVKPFYYAWNNGQFIFASEIKSLFAHPLSREFDRDAFNEYMRVLYVPSPRTMFKAISKLPPGHMAVLSAGRLTVSVYYEPTQTLHPISYSVAKTAVKSAVEEAVKNQMVADVPVGVYLSGGIDSSAVLASAVKVHERINTFSVGFDLEDGEEAEKFNRDFDLAALTAEHFGATHHPLKISAHEVAASLEEIIGSIDDIISNPTAIPMYHLARFAKQQVTVVLSGNGGDELFGGYERYRISRIADLLDLPLLRTILPPRIKTTVQNSAVERLAQFEFEKDIRLARVMNPAYMSGSSTVLKRFEPIVKRSHDATSDLMQLDLRTWLPDQALALGDRMSMQGSLEERVPLLDRALVDLAFGLPISYKVTPFATKKILKDAFRDVLPDVLFDEPKRGWFSPGAKWIRRPEILSLFKEVLRPGYHSDTDPLFDWSAVNRMLEDHVSKKEYNLTILWAIFSFRVWARTYKVTL